MTQGWVGKRDPWNGQGVSAQWRGAHCHHYRYNQKHSPQSLCFNSAQLSQPPWLRLDRCEHPEAAEGSFSHSLGAEQEQDLGQSSQAPEPQGRAGDLPSSHLCPTHSCCIWGSSCSSLVFQPQRGPFPIPGSQRQAAALTVAMVSGAVQSRVLLSGENCKTCKENLWSCFYCKGENSEGKHHQEMLWSFKYLVGGPGHPKVTAIKSVQAGERDPCCSPVPNPCWAQLLGMPQG